MTAITVRGTWRWLSPLMVVGMSSVLRSQALDCTGAAFARCPLDRPLGLHGDPGSIAFPRMFEGTLFSGSVSLVVSVDTAGAMNRYRMRVLSASHQLFSSVVTSGLATMRFDPPTRDGRKTAVTVGVTVDFVMPHSDTVPSRDAWAIERTDTGFHIVAGRTAIDRVVTATALDAETERRVRWAVAVQLLPLVEADSSRRTCVSVQRTHPDAVADSAFIEALRARDSSVVGMTSCPRTYGGWIRPVDSTGRRLVRPRGALDPIILGIGDARVWTSSVVSVAVVTNIAGRGRHIWCQVERDGAGEWRASCKTIDYWNT